MRIKAFIISALLAGAIIVPSALSFGAERNWGSVECYQFLKTPKITSSSGNIKFIGKNPKITIGDKGAEDTMLLFDGNAQDWHVALDDSSDFMVFGLGSTAGTTERISLNPANLSVLIGDATEADVWIEFDGNAQNFHIGIDDTNDKFVIGLGSALGTTERMTFNSGDLGILIGDATAADVWFTFDGIAQDYYIGIDDGTDDLYIGLGSTMGTTPALTIDENQIVSFPQTVVLSGGQTRKHQYYPADIDLDDSTPPAKVTLSGGTGNVWEVLQFDADAGSTGDDICYIKWHVPDGYIVDSGRLNIVWSCESAETTGDDVVFDMTVAAIASGEAVDAAMTAFTQSADEQWTGTADLLFTTQLDFEVLTIAVDDTVYITFFVDETASEFTDTIDVHLLEIEWESTE